MSERDRLLLREAYAFDECTEKLSDDGSAIVSQVSSDIEMLRILYAYRVAAITPSTPKLGVVKNVLFRIRSLLGLSWDELRIAMCSLRKISGPDITQLPNHRTWIVDETVLATFDTGSVMVELAKGSLCHIRAIIENQIHWLQFREIVPLWGFFVRACPPSPELLNDLSELTWASDSKIAHFVLEENLYNVVQWLKTFRPIPVELVNRFEPELDHCFLRNRSENRDSLEKEWMQWWEKCQEYGKHLPIFEPRKL
ncbi:hypothetical protein C8R45DRAFT_195202 [Mycena sanguinolenta]|nr:hypothetical protein C8R45DRAFT_195202 [Mycena sanguinolenta]